MRLELSFTDYSKTDVGKPVEFKNISQVQRVNDYLSVMDRGEVIPEMFALAKIADIRLAVCED